MLSWFSVLCTQVTLAQGTALSILRWVVQAKEMVQELKAFVVLAEELGFIPSTRIVVHRHLCNAKFQRFLCSVFHRYQDHICCTQILIRIRSNK